MCVVFAVGILMCIGFLCVCLSPSDLREDAAGRTEVCYQSKRGMVLLTEIPLPRIAQQGAAGLISIRGQARTTRIEKFELDEGFQPSSSPLPTSSA